MIPEPASQHPSMASRWCPQSPSTTPSLPPGPRRFKDAGRRTQDAGRRTQDAGKLPSKPWKRMCSPRFIVGNSSSRLFRNDMAYFSSFECTTDIRIWDYTHWISTIRYFFLSSYFFQLITEYLYFPRSKHRTLFLIVIFHLTVLFSTLWFVIDTWLI